MDVISSNNYADCSVDIPSIPIDDYIHGIIEEYKNSSRSLWICSQYTYDLFEQFGLYERHFTDTLVVELGIQKDTIYHWRKAWALRLNVLEVNPQFSFKNLSISHFYNAADFVEKLGSEAVAEWLQVAGDEKWSSRKLTEELRIASNDSGEFSWLIRRLGKIAIQLERLFENSEFAGLTDDKRKKLQQSVIFIKEILG